MDWDAIIGLSAAPGLVIIVTVVVWLFRRRRTRRDPDRPPSAQVYRSPLMLKVTGWAGLTAAHVTITRSNGRKTRFNISFQHTFDFSPLHEWAEAHHRRDLLAPSTRLTQAPRHP